jgi:3-phenylpropionate/trans-cinnamate dioxygenase ferredoxin reductase subunit
VPPTFVIVGASLAGGTAAITLRKEGFDGDILLIGAEPTLPYERPGLSKQYLRGAMTAEKLLVRPGAFYEEQRIDLLLGARATRVDPAAHTVDLDTGRSVRYDKLLIATGVKNRRPPIPGLDLPGVYSLRTIGDADALRGEIAPGRRAVVIGMGFIGCEVTASLRQQEVDVVAVDPSPAPLFRVLGAAIGGAIAGVHAEHGVEMLFGDGVAAFEGGQRVERVVTSQGKALDCDFAVVGVGVEPELALLADSGLDISNGVVVDEYGRASAPDVYAAGDVANHYHPLFGRHMRVEHWHNALNQSAAAARTMLGRERPYDAIPWFWSDQYDMNLQYAGAHERIERVVIRGSLEEKTFLAFFMSGRRIDAIVAMNRGKDLRRAMPMIRTREIEDDRELEREP